jgi:hypothetical protein
VGEAVNFGRNYPRVIIVESHPAFDGNWNFDGIVRWRMGDRNDVRYDTIWELRDLFVAKHDSTRAVLQPLNLFFLSFAMPEVRVANHQARMRTFRESVLRDDLLPQPLHGELDI